MEVKFFKTEAKFFTRYNPPKADADSEWYEPGTSETVPDQVEPVSVTVARCLRGEVLSNSSLRPAYYELDDAKSVDEAFSRMDPTDSAGFDLADVPSLLTDAGASSEGEQREAPKESELETGSSAKTESTADSNQS